MRQNYSLFLVCGMLCFLLAACGYVYSDSKLVPIMENAIQTAMQEPDTPAVLQLTTVTDFIWDQVVIMPPYTDPKALEKELDLELDRARHTRIIMRDDIHVLLFLKNGETLSFMEYPRAKGDFDISRATVFDTGSALFRLLPQASGPVKLVPIE